MMKKTKAKIGGFDGEIAILETGSGNINLPKDMLPDTAKEGDVVFLSVASEEEALRNREELAQSLLNEVLKEE